MKRILITGGTGFVGSALTKKLTTMGNEVYILTRNHTHTNEKNVQYVEWMNGHQPELPSIDAVINLAGESINGRWTDEKKKAILNSRLKVTDNLLQLVEKMVTKPSVWINASAVGFYGTSEAEVYTEETKKHGEDFLAEVVKAWETKASEAESLGCRTVFTRFGLVLGRDGGVLPQLSLPYRFFAGGTVGSGNQWVSWVHIEDVVQLIKDIVENPKHLQFDANYEAALLPKIFKNGEGDAVLINSNYAIDNGLDPMKDAIAHEPADAKSPYVNIIAVRQGDENKPEIKTLVQVLQSKQIQDWITKQYKGAVLPVSK